MKFLPILAILFLLTSCHQPKVATVTKTSSDGKTTVTIVGKKETPLDPFHVTLTVKSGDIPEGSLIFEIAASDLTDHNVRFDWSDPQHAIITITQTDDDKKIFKLSVSDTQVIVAPVL